MAKAKGTAVVNCEEELARRAALFKQAEASVAVGQFINLRGGIMQYQGSPLQDNQMDAIVLDSLLVNAFYVGAFDPAKPAVPVCYAFGREGGEMKPHEKCSEPQHAQCKGCPNNEFGSAEQGRGKACKNQRRLALISATPLNAQSVEKADMAYLMLPPTSVQGWAAYVNKLAELLKVPPFGVITTIKCVADPKTQFKVTFNAKGQVKDRAIMAALMARADEAAKLIAFPYPEMDETPAPKSRAQRGNGKSGRTGARKF